MCEFNGSSEIPTFVAHLRERMADEGLVLVPRKILTEEQRKAIRKITVKPIPEAGE